MHLAHTLRERYKRLSIKTKVIACLFLVFTIFLLYYAFTFLDGIHRSQAQYIASVSNTVNQTAIHYDYRFKEMTNISNNIYLLLNSLSLTDQAPPLTMIDAYFAVITDIRRIGTLYPDYRIRIYARDGVLFASEQAFFFPLSLLGDSDYVQRETSKPILRYDEQEQCFELTRAFGNTNVRDVFAHLSITMTRESISASLPHDMWGIDIVIEETDKDGVSPAQATLPGRDILVSAPLAFAGWRVATLIPYELIVNNSRTQLAANIAVLVALIALWILNVLYIYRILLKRIVDVSERMSKFDGTRIQPKPAKADAIDDEISIIERTFDQACLRVLALIEDIQVVERKKRAYELTAMQKMINPHFLYNCLDIINRMGFDMGSTQICTFTAALGRFYRLCLHNGKTIIPLRDEIELCRQYVKIQQIRYQDRMRVVFEVDPEAEDHLCIKMTLQPLLENAIKHSIYLYEESQEQAQIRIAVTLADNQVQVRIANSCPAMHNPDEPSEFDKDNSGFGIKNIRERLALYFGASCGIRFERGDMFTVHLWFDARTDEPAAN